MKKEIIKRIILAFSITLIAYFINKAVFFLPELKHSYESFHYTLETLYAVFFVFSAVILTILSVVKEKNLDQVGMTFLLITSVKMGGAFFMGKPILADTNQNLVEKINYFVIFILFLAIETIITIRLLNKEKQLGEQNTNSSKK